MYRVDFDRWTEIIRLDKRVILEADFAEVSLAVEDHFLSFWQENKFVYNKADVCLVTRLECEGTQGAICTRWAWYDMHNDLLVLMCLRHHEYTKIRLGPDRKLFYLSTDWQAHGANVLRTATPTVVRCAEV